MNNIDHFTVSVEGSDPIIECTVEANADPLECELTELTPASEYIIQTYSCLAGSLGCSSPVEGVFWTYPMRKWKAWKHTLP